MELSDGAANRRVTAGRTRARRKAVPRGGRHGLTRASAITSPDDVESFIELAPVQKPAKASVATTLRASRAPELDRDVEMAYVRSDLRKLSIIASGLLAFMLVILVFVGR